MCGILRRLRLRLRLRWIVRLPFVDYLSVDLLYLDPFHRVAVLARVQEHAR